MYERVRVSVIVRVCECGCIYVCECVCECAYMCLGVCMYACMCVCECVHACACVWSGGRIREREGGRMVERAGVRNNCEGSTYPDGQIRFCVWSDGEIRACVVQAGEGGSGERVGLHGCDWAPTGGVDVDVVDELVDVVVPVVRILVPKSTHHMQ